jgi:hypothetical protein
MKGGGSDKIYPMPPPAKIYERQEITTLVLLTSLIRQIMVLFTVLSTI